VIGMANGDEKAKIRSMTLEDLDAILAIDHKIRAMGKAITYANLTTERIFTIDRKSGRLARPVSYVELITGDVTGLLEFGLVAEVKNHVRGFILGREGHMGAAGTQVGLILILGVNPDYWHKGIAKELVRGLCDQFRKKGIRAVHIGIDQRDKDLIGFFEGMGFSVGHLIDYSRSL